MNSTFFRNHLVGMVIFAVSTGLLVNFLWDEIKAPVPKNSESRTSYAEPPSINASATKKSKKGSDDSFKDIMRIVNSARRAEPQFKDSINKAVCKYFVFFFTFMEVDGKKNSEVLEHTTVILRELNSMNLAGVPKEFINEVDDRVFELTKIISVMRHVVDGDKKEEEAYPLLTEFMKNYLNSLKIVFNSVNALHRNQDGWDTSDDKKIWDEVGFNRMRM